MPERTWRRYRALSEECQNRTRKWKTEIIQDTMLPGIYFYG